MHSKVITTIVLSVVLIVLTSAHSFAVDTEGGLHFDVHDGWEQTELGKKEKDLIFHGESKSLGLELGVFTHRTIQTNLENNWIDLSEAELEAKAEDVINSQKENGDIIVNDYSILNTDQMRFIVFNGIVKNKESKEKNFIQYLTIVNGESLHFSFYSDTPLTKEQLAASEAIVHSARVDALTEKKIDNALIIKLAGLALVLILMIASVIWHVRHYRKKTMKKGDFR
ncbi:MAG: hypothetical protein IJH43_09155 [Mogibacterium sp.]|nr:hypothetical protein [Mogibacterium sp.]